MAIAIDLVLLIVILLFVFLGYRKGALATLISLVGGIAAVFLALLLAAPIGNALADRYVAPALKAPICEVLTENVTGELSPSALMSDPPEELEGLISALDLSAADFEGVQHLPDALADAIARPAASTLCFAVSFLALFFLFSVLVRILISLAKKFNKIPVLGTANRVIGLLLGLIHGLLLAWALACGIHLLMPYLSAPGGLLFGFSEESTLLYRVLFRLNPIALISTYLLGR